MADRLPDTFVYGVLCLRLERGQFKSHTNEGGIKTLLNSRCHARLDTEYQAIPIQLR